MPIKDPTQRKEYHAKYIREHYRANKDYYRERNKATEEKVQELIRQAKSQPCADCGIQYPYYVMDFDHKGNKSFNLASGKSRGMNVVKREIAKCDVVCANCHRERTYAPVV